MTTSDERREQALRALDAIQDPCSVSLGHPISLVGMGIVADVMVTEGVVRVELLPTFPTCLFRGVFQEQVEMRLSRLPWCTAVSVIFRDAGETWDEDRMEPGALAALRAARAARRLSVRP